MAVKVFRGDVSPDGQMVDEVDIACALDHPNLTRCPPPPLVVICHAPQKPSCCCEGATKSLRSRVGSVVWCKTRKVHAPWRWHVALLLARQVWSCQAARLEALALPPSPCYAAC